jgi:hypothetical protein
MRKIAETVGLALLALLWLAVAALACSSLVEEVVVQNGNAKLCVYANGAAVRVCSFCNCPICAPGG